MKPLLTKVTSAIAGGVVLLAGCVMAGLGLSVLAILGLFALAALGLAVLVRPFVTLAEDDLQMRQADPARATASAA